MTTEPGAAKFEELVVTIQRKLMYTHWGSGIPWRGTAEHVAEGLVESGLLATPAMRQAVEACKRYMVNNPHGTAYMAEANALCFKAGAACLAEEAERAPTPEPVLTPLECLRAIAKVIRDADMDGLERGK